MTDEVEKIVSALHGWNAYGESLERCNTELEAAKLIEKLAAERDHWKARCKSAERDLYYVRNCSTCKYFDVSKCDLNAEKGTVAYERWFNCLSSGDRSNKYFGSYEWRGAQEDKADE